MGEKGNVLSSAQTAAGAAPGTVDQVVGLAGDAASTAGGVVAGAATDVAQEHVSGQLGGLLHRGDKGEEEETAEVGGSPEAGSTDADPA
jgi:hypothetical protein